MATSRVRFPGLALWLLEGVGRLSGFDPPENSTHEAQRGQAVSTVSTEVDEVRRQMGQIRRELHEDVREVVASAEAATDWKHYLTLYPWVSLGLAFAAGYLVVPRRHKPSPAGVATQADLSQVRQAVESTRQTLVDVAKGKDPKSAAERKGTLIGAAFGMIAPLAVRAVQGYAMKYLEQWINQQQMNLLQAGPPPAHAGPQAGPGQGPMHGPRRPGGPAGF